VRVQIDIRRPGWARLPRTWRMRALLTVVAAGVVAVPVAWASHQFGDVPDSNPHHADISAIFNARITAGCNPPANTLYCPDHAVRRDQMASFMRRGLGRVGATQNASAAALTSSFQNLATVSIITGGTTGGTGFVLVNGSGSALAIAGALTGNNRVEYRIVRDAGGASATHTALLYPSSPGAPAVNLGVSAAFAVPTGTIQTFRLQGRINFGSGPIRAEANSLTALYVPFGAGGGNVLGDGAEEQPAPQSGVDPDRG
jgi:hypothetical protein